MSDVKYYLRQLFRIDAEIERLNQERESLYADILKVSKWLDVKVQESGGNQSESLFMKIAEYATYITEKYEEKVEWKIKISKEIDKLDNPDYRNILSYRYVIGFDWDTIENKLNYSNSHIHRLHSKSLQAFEKVNKKSIELYLKMRHNGS